MYIPAEPTILEHVHRHARPQMANVFLYAVLELASLMGMCVLLWRRLRLSLVHQIAFVLETRQASIQSKVLIWVTVVVQNAIRQFGVDYSFQFAWLHAEAPLRRPTT